MAKGKGKFGFVVAKGQKDIRGYLLPKKPQTDIRSFLVPKNPPKKACVKNKEVNEGRQILKPVPQTVQSQMLMRLPLMRLEMHYKYLSKSDSCPPFFWGSIRILYERVNCNIFVFPSVRL